MHDIGTPDVACAVRTSTLHAAIFRAHSARYCMKAQVYECTNFVESDLEKESALWQLIPLAVP